MGAEQLGLFGAGELTFDARYAALRRAQLSAGAWVEHQPAWVSGHRALYDHLAHTTRWRESAQQMYDRTVVTPRLIAVLPDDGPGHPILEAMQRSLSQRYRQRFERVSLALYRDGRDSVAFHGDRVARTLPNALVATVSLGAPRRFLMRPHGGGSSNAWNLGWGDLFVMGGDCQRTWQHAVPKVAHADPRISVMFRPRWDGDEALYAPEPSERATRVERR